MNLCAIVQNYMNAYMELWPFSGSILVVKNGEIVADEAYGQACIEWQVPNQPGTRYGLASVSKQFTAFAIMQLADQGRIDLDHAVNHYLPDELKLDDRITAHHLLSHTSGLPVFHGLHETFYGKDDKTNYDRSQYMRLFQDRPLRFAPGTSYEYSNAGYSMLAYLVEEVSGRGFKEYLDQAIFQPLGMLDTVLDDGMELLKNKAFGYCMNGERIVRGEYHDLAYSMGAGGLVSNTADLYRWHQGLKNRALLGGDMYDRFFQENRSGYCYGLFKDHFLGKSRFQHDGAYLGIGAYMQNFFEEDSCVIVLCNYDFVNVFQVGNALSRLILGGEADIPRMPAEIVLDEELARKYEGVYIKDRVELRRVEGRWEFVYLGRFRRPLYPTGSHQFHSTWLDHGYTLTVCEDGGFTFLGYRKEEDNL
ncbi:serine hydrolase domain-containing protein [Paenibacillus nasutitermitis]|uniref:Serine hydrolase n=1 Tax=Paenibacillus nasutitermitis TaxID=1652958 RepID=A0A917DZQ2_9BACL|nr:serine hydrolase domain-containing protein [Paenibacillus nasutitermitis]GGD84361.1 serine hydrolase [Paenibacillus nasutitermitis]